MADPFKSDFLTSNLQPLNGSKLTYGGSSDPFSLASQNTFGSMNLTGGNGASNAHDRRRAGEFVSDLLDK